MSVIKSFSVGCGDMFYIEHNSDNFTIIDCCIGDENKDSILDEIDLLSSDNGITRFISLHPDDDHLRGLDLLDDRLGILNFYCVRNTASKEKETDCFTRYCELRDSNKAFYIEKGCTRRWMNQTTPERGSAGINVLWPNVNNPEYKKALEDATKGLSPNNISAIVRYSVENGATALWMGDLETAFMERVAKELDLPEVDILFPPHHGRDSGKVPACLLAKMSPRIIVVGEAPSEHLCYYDGYNTITQNSAGDIVFECESGAVHIFVSNFRYTVDFLDDWARTRRGFHYLGTLDLSKTR